MPSKLTPSKQNSIRTLLESGEHPQTIAELVGCGEATVRRYARDFGIPVKKFRYDREQLILDVLNKKYSSYQEAANAVGLTRQAIYEMVKGYKKNERG